MGSPLTKIIRHVNLLLLICIAHVGLAQDRKDDLIVKRNNTRIVCRILVVDNESVQYKKANDPEGPVFKEPKSQIARIVYGNGDVENFPAQDTRVYERGSFTTDRYARTPWKSPGFMENLQGQCLLELRHTRDFFNSKAKETKALALAFGTVGLATAIAGAIVMGSADDAGGHGYYGSDEEKRTGGKMLVGLGLSTGICFGVLGGLASGKYRRKLRLVESELSNRKASQSQLRIRPVVDPFRKSASVSLALEF